MTLDAWNTFVERVDAVAAERPADMAAVAARIGQDGRDADDALTDQLDALAGAVASDCANAVDDDEADDVIALVERRFADDVLNASVERRVAALLTAYEPDDIGV